jgi:cell division protein ZipA
MQELRIVFIVAGVIAILGILVHGLWSIRKNAQVKKSLAAELLPPEEKADNLIDSDDPLLDQNIHFQPVSREEPIIDDIEAVETDDDIHEESIVSDKNYDDLGLGAVRVVSQEPKSESVEANASYNLKAEDADLSDSVEDGNQPKSDKLFEKAPEYDMRLSRADRNDEWVESSMPPPPNSLLKGESATETERPDIPEVPEDVMAEPSFEAVTATQPETVPTKDSQMNTPLAKQRRSIE